VMIFYSPIGSRDSKMSWANSTVYLKKRIGVAAVDDHAA
jgi:hypothetical protein